MSEKRLRACRWNGASSISAELGALVSDLEANLPALQREARQLLRWAANPTTNPEHSRAFFEANQEGVHDGGEWLEVNVVQLGGGPLNKAVCSGDSGYGAQKADLLAVLCYVLRKHQHLSGQKRHFCTIYI